MEISSFSRLACNIMISLSCCDGNYCANTYFSCDYCGIFWFWLSKACRAAPRDGSVAWHAFHEVATDPVVVTSVVFWTLSRQRPGCTFFGLSDLSRNRGAHLVLQCASCYL